MPLNEYGEKLDSNGYAPSILHDKPVCLICGRYGTARHEVYFGSAGRRKRLWNTTAGRKPGLFRNLGGRIYE